MIKKFGQWQVVKDGIETVPGVTYLWISKKEIMAKDITLAKTYSTLRMVNAISLKQAYKYAYLYFHAMTKVSATSHPEVHRAIKTAYMNVKWKEIQKGDYITEVPTGIYLIVYKKDDGRWAWCYKGIYSKRTYKSEKTAKKKVYASYYWLYHYIKNQDNQTFVKPSTKVDSWEFCG